MSKTVSVPDRFGMKSAISSLALAGWLTGLAALAPDVAAQDQAAQSPAQDPAQPNQDIPLGYGMLNAKAYQPIPAGAAFDVVVQDPNDPNRAELEGTVLDQVVHELAKAKYRVSQDAPLVMLVGTDLIRGTSKEATLEEYRGTGDTGFTYQHNIYSSNKPSLLHTPTPDGRPNTFRISLSVYDRQTGLYIWRGSIDRGTSDLTPDKAADRMIPALIGTIGKNINNQSVQLGHD